MVTRRQGLSRHHFCFIAYPEKLGERVKVVTKSDAPYPVLVDTPGLVSLNLPFVNQADGFLEEEFGKAGEARLQPPVRVRMFVVLGLRPVQEVRGGVSEEAHDYPAGHPSSLHEGLSVLRLLPEGCHRVSFGGGQTGGSALLLPVEFESVVPTSLSVSK